jgi:malonate transporter and related proteins
MNHLIRAVDLVIPVFLVIVLGYVVGRRAVFDRQGATVLNRLVIGFALPATLFVGTVAQTRSDLFEQLPLFGLIAVGLLGLYLVILVLLRYVFRRELHESALLALAATQPMFAFMGIPVLSGLLGPTKAELPIAIAGILVNVIMVPLTIILLQHPSSSTSPYRVARADGPGAPLATGATTSIRVDRRGAGIALAIGSTFKQSIVWAPILAFILVLAAVPVPKIITDSLGLLGGASSGVALLFVGVAVAQMKRVRMTLRGVGLALFSLLIQPLVVLAVGHAVGVGGTTTSVAVLTVAFPISPVPLLLASKYDAKETDELSSALILSVVLSIVTLTLWLIVTS